jgi:CBS domain containing-hemolysin-like protein
MTALDALVPALELLAALLLAGSAALARAAAGAHRVLAAGVPAGVPPLASRPAESREAARGHEQAALLAEVMWLGLLAPALLLVAHGVLHLAPWLPWIGELSGVAAAAAVALAVGSELPLRLGAMRPERFASLSAPLLRAAAPLRPLAARLGRSLASVAPPEPAAAEARLIERLFEASNDSDEGEDEDSLAMRQLLGRVLHLRETPVSDLMRPREVIVWIGQRAKPEAAAEIMRSTRHSRLPVCGRDLDDVVSILHLKDVFLALQSAMPAVTADAIGRQPSLVQPGLSLSGLLAGWRLEGGQMSIVREASGKVVGLITLGDVIDWLLAPLGALPLVPMPEAGRPAGIGIQP